MFACRISNLKSFGDVDRFDVGRGLEVGVDDELVSHKALLANEVHVVGLLQSLHHVVRVENGDLCGTLEALAAHHLDVSPRDGQNGRRAPRCGRTRAERAGARHLVDVDDWMAWQEGSQVGLDTDRSHAWTTTAVWLIARTHHFK